VGEATSSIGQPDDVPAIDAKWIDTLVDGFEDGSLPPSSLTHAAHLVLALVYARQYAPDPAEPFRHALRHYLQRRAGDTRAYHETITRAWMHLVLAFCREHAELDLPAAARTLVARHPSKYALDAHYTRARLLSDDARVHWLEPDLAPLP
jgi:hypothetical protein